QHVLWFDEYYNGHEDYQWERVLGAASSSALVLFVGTSFAVGVTDLVLSSARERGILTFSVDPVPQPLRGVTSIASPSERFLPAVVEALG
ncbi:MAG TPA: RNA polymerase subunit sigma, partial [Myxococcaceae bacterium]|nr:RNA polymerase subunit sigma [Myxococcaceae bacterium]